MSTTHHTVRIPSATRHLATVRRFVERVGQDAGIPEAVLHAVQLAVDEACANIIEHGYQGRSDGDLQIEARTDGAVLALTIRHHGAPFQPTAYHPLPLTEALEERKRRGYGLRLIHRLMDDVEFAQARGASEVRLKKRYA